MTYRVKEIFGPTLQGEGTHTGLPVKFLRFALCNKWSGYAKDKPSSICHYCDTDFVGGEAMTAVEIVDALNALGEVRTVVISGGEPTIQLNVEILSALKAAGYTIHLETNGSNALGDCFSLIDHITMSPKQSLEETKLEACHDLKLLYPPIDKDISPRHFEEFPHSQMFLQPIWDQNYKVNLDLTTAALYRRPAAKLSLQTHKIIGVQ